MLTEAEFFFIHAEGHHQVVRACHEPCHRWMQNDALGQCLGDRGHKGIALGRDEVDVGRGPDAEIVGRLGFWVDEILQLSHVELTQTNHALTG